MLDDENPTTDAEGTTTPTPPEDAAPSGAGTEGGDGAAAEAPAKKTAAKRTPRKASARTAKKAASARPAGDEPTGEGGSQPVGEDSAGAEAQRPSEEEAPPAAPAKKTTRKAPSRTAAKKTAAKRTTKKVAASEAGTATDQPPAAGTEVQAQGAAADTTPEPEDAAEGAESPAAAAAAATAAAPATALLFQPPDPTKAVTPPRRRKKAQAKPAEAAEGAEAAQGAEPQGGRADTGGTSAEDGAPGRDDERASDRRDGDGETSSRTDADGGADGAADGGAEGGADGGEQAERRRRRRGGRRRRKGGGEGTDAADDRDEAGADAAAEGGTEKGSQKSPEKGSGRSKGSAKGAGPDEQDQDKEQGSSDDDTEDQGTGSRRRRRRRRSGDGESGGETDNGAKGRKSRNAEDEITALSGSTRLEAKKQRRREGREAGRRRAPIVSEAEFLARRESVDRVMVIRQREDLTQIAVLEDKVLVEHYVSRESQTSLIGNVYLGRVQNVLPSMEAAFIDIGKGRNAVLYAGEVNWDALGAKNGQPRKIESVLKSGQSILVQVTKDPVGHKGARLTSQVSLPGRFLVYVPDGTTSGISRKLPDTERSRLKTLLKEIVPESAGVIVRTAAEGASEDELTRDVERLTARWEDIERKSKNGNAPQLLYGEPDLTLKVVRDLFTEDFKRLVVSGDDAWDMVEGYVQHVAPDLADRLERYDDDRDVFAAYRIDEQIEKALDRKVWLPSGGSLVIDRTEAMTVVDVNTGKFTGSGGNLEETVTKNNLEAAEEIVRQLRLRDIGGIIVVDFIDMVLESNRDLVLRRLVECLGRDRTRHQVAEVTSLGLVQMTRKRIGTGLLEAFSEPCEHCAGRGLVLHAEPVEARKKDDDSRRGGGRRSRGGRGRGEDRQTSGAGNGSGNGVPSPKDIAAMARPEEPTREAQREDQREDRREDRRDDRAEETTSATAEPGPSQDEQPSTSAESPAEPTAEPARETGAAPAREAGTDAAPASVAPAGAGTDGDGAAPTAQPEVEQRERANPAPPAGPTVVTTVRRRSARRAAGPPQAAASETAHGVAQEATREVPDSGAVDEPVDEPGDAEPLAVVVDDAEVEQENGTEGGSEGEPPAETPHVPVKKRGARRR